MSIYEELCYYFRGIVCLVPFLTACLLFCDQCTCNYIQQIIHFCLLQCFLYGFQRSSVTTCSLPLIKHVLSFIIFAFIPFANILELLLRNSKGITELSPVWPKRFWKLSESVVGNLCSPQTAGFLHLGCNINICARITSIRFLEWPCVTVAEINLLNVTLILNRLIASYCPEIGHCCTGKW